MALAALVVLAVVGGGVVKVWPLIESTGDEVVEVADEGAAPAVEGAPAAAVPTTGSLHVESVPPGAQVTLDGVDAGRTPLTLKEVKAGRHKLVLQGESGTLERSVRVQAGERTVARYEIAAGFLSLVSRIPLEVFDGTRRIGNSADGHFLLAPGPHTLRVANTRFAYETTVDFDVRPGEITTHTMSLPEGTLTVVAEPGSVIFVEGEPVGTTPLGPISVQIGTRDVVARHPQFGERGEAVEVVYGQPTEVQIVLEGTEGPREVPQLAPLSRQPERLTPE